jgi:hypothetical protein
LVSSRRLEYDSRDRVHRLIPMHVSVTDTVSPTPVRCEERPMQAQSSDADNVTTRAAVDRLDGEWIRSHRQCGDDTPRRESYRVPKH